MKSDVTAPSRGLGMLRNGSSRGRVFCASSCGHTSHAECETVDFASEGPTAPLCCAEPPLLCAKATEICASISSTDDVRATSFLLTASPSGVSLYVRGFVSLCSTSPFVTSVFSPSLDQLLFVSGVFAEGCAAAPSCTPCLWRVILARTERIGEKAARSPVPSSRTARRGSGLPPVHTGTRAEPSLCVADTRALALTSAVASSQRRRHPPQSPPSACASGPLVQPVAAAVIAAVPSSSADSQRDQAQHDHA
jgi:hypothetical protein